MSSLIVFIIIAIVGALINSSAKRRRAAPNDQPDVLPGNVRERWTNASRTRPAKPPQKHMTPIKGSFAELVAQFDQQREQIAQQFAEGTGGIGSLQYESTEGQDTPGHDHGFTTIHTGIHPSLPLEGGGRTRQRWRESAPLTATARQLRQAVIMAEVLGRPVSQRRRT